MPPELKWATTCVKLGVAALPHYITPGYRRPNKQPRYAKVLHRRLGGLPRTSVNTSISRVG